LLALAYLAKMHRAMIVLAISGLFKVASLIHEILRVLLALISETVLILALECPSHLLILSCHVTRARLR